MLQIFRSFILLLLLMPGLVWAGEVSVTKQVVGGNNNDFEMTIDGNLPIIVTDGQNTGFVSVVDGTTITITETSNGMSQYTDVAYQCFDAVGNLAANGIAPIQTGGGGGSASFSLDIPVSTNPLETRITCVIYNIKRASLLISKSTLDGDTTTAFNFDVTGSGVSSTLQLTGGQTGEVSLGRNFSGTLTISETLPATWQVQNVTCTRLTDGVIIFSGTATSASITLARGDDVLCVFTNSLIPGRILIEKTTIPAGDPQLFEFVPDYAPSFTLSDADVPNDSGDLQPGIYSVVETAVAGWDLISASCDDGSDPSAIDLAAAEIVTCTFVNDKLIADLSLTKDDGQSTFTPGTSFSYTITINNNGPDRADGSVFTDILPAWAENVTWTCSATGGAVCPNNTGSGNNITETIATFPNGGELSYVVNGDYSADMSNY